MSSRLLSCAKAAIPWATSTDVVRSRELAGARMALSGQTQQIVHEARRTVDPTLPDYASLSASEAAQLETIATAVVSQGQNVGVPVPISARPGIGAHPLNSQWTAGKPGGNWSVRLGTVTTLMHPSDLDRIQERWFFTRVT